MRVLFVFKSENFLAPIGLCCVSAAARAAGHEVSLCELNSQDLFRKIDDAAPGVIAYSSSTGEAKHYIRINREIKNRYPHMFTVMGGPHPTFNPVAAEEGRLDAVCVGEGDMAFPELLDRLGEGGGTAGMDNIVTPGEGSCRVRNLVEDLDLLPFPDYELLYDNTPMGKYPLKNFMVSRGCPYGCSYCFNKKWNEFYKGKGRIVRRHSVDYVIEDIERVKRRWPLSNVKFYDDIFSYRADRWLEEFAEKYRKKIGLPFFMLTRADLLDEDMARLLKYAGCRTISMSIESGNDYVRNQILKRNMTEEQILDAHRLCRKYSIYTFTNLITGIPGTTMENEIESVELAVKSRVDWAEFLIYHPYPGTELGDDIIRKGLYRARYGRMHTSYMHATPIESFSARQKRVFSNMSVLGSVAVVFPVSRKIIMNYLVFLKHNRIFTLVYYIIKMRIIRKKIYVTKTGLLNSLSIFLRSLRQEFFRHEVKD